MPISGSEKVTTISVAGGNIEELLAALNKIESRATEATQASATLRVCFEAGYDGFWLARFLIDRGIDTTVLDASSFLVSRRSEEHTSELQSLMRTPYSVFCFHK